METRDQCNGGYGATATAMIMEAEGPILLSTTRVDRNFVFQQLRQTVEQFCYSNVMSGTYCTEDGVSALTDIDRNDG